MGLFRGRADVYPKRWVNTRKDTKGYSPACSNEWVRGVCDKRSVKCGECPNQAFIPVTEKTIHDHFQGRHVIGVYPMLQDESCCFLAVDFDKGKWQDDVSAFVNTCKARSVPHAVERSRSGSGAHVWFFFAAPVSASAARKMGCFLLTETMAGRHELPMTSYDRFFPNQDTMPRGGFGNLIALPFQDGPRQQGNSVFVDETWTPFPDQWAFLASVHRMQPGEVDRLAYEAVRKGLVLGVKLGDPAADKDSETPWTRSPSRKRSMPEIPGPLPPRVNAVLSQLLYVETAGLPSPLINQIKRLAAFQNPEFYKEIYRQLSRDETRNRLILDDVVQALEEKRSPILLTERRDHLEYFADRLQGLARNLIILQGGMKTKDRRAAIEKLTTIPETEERLVLATGRFIGEGFDDARLDTLFLAMPVSWKGTLVQYAGRLHRKHHAKTEVRMMDYVDRNVPMLARMFEKRMRGYRAMGYSAGDHGIPDVVKDDYVIEYDTEILRDLED